MQIRCTGAGAWRKDLHNEINTQITHFDNYIVYHTDRILKRKKVQKNADLIRAKRKKAGCARCVSYE